ncbi:hypothetical protein ACCO45_009959 [Purpureocillium lilacinum]|uniref:Uncharacterized protein n=1 Tax=Purpureocillium lilacinum TaxID=33203 RepID=A0ACC4DDR9_PURLI
MGSRHHQRCAVRGAISYVSYPHAPDPSHPTLNDSEKEEDYCDEMEEPDDYDGIFCFVRPSRQRILRQDGRNVEAVQAVTAWLAWGFGGGWVWQNHLSKGVRLNAVEWGGTWRKSTATRSGMAEGICRYLILLVVDQPAHRREHNVQVGTSDNKEAATIYYGELHSKTSEAILENPASLVVLSAGNERIGRPPLPDLVAVHARYEVDQCVLRYFERVEASYPAVPVINDDI